MTRYSHPETVALILAAGMGKRMNSDLPKVLHPMAGTPLLGHVLRMLETLGVSRRVAVIGHRREQVVEAFRGAPNVEWAVQAEQRGTGHAVLCAGEALAGFGGSLLVVCGDTPLLRASTMHALIEGHRASGAAVTVLSMRLPDPKGYGRVVRTADGGIDRIVEEKDASDEIRRLDEVNSGIYVFDYPKLASVLGRLTAENAQGEYYLTDTVALLRANGHRAAVVLAEDYRETLGINTVPQLDEAETIWRELQAKEART